MPRSSKRVLSTVISAVAGDILGATLAIELSFRLGLAFGTGIDFGRDPVITFSTIHLLIILPVTFGYLVASRAWRGRWMTVLKWR